MQVIVVPVEKDKFYIHWSLANGNDGKETQLSPPRELLRFTSMIWDATAARW